MRKLPIILLSAFLIQPLFAQDVTDSDSKPCADIAKACLDAGYTRESTADKMFWKDCMKPIILGKTVSGVTIDATTAKMCRTNKIAKMKKELQEIQNAK